MTKEKLYQKIQALFPSELAVGDVVEDAQFGQWEALFINTMHQGIPLWCFQNIGNQETALWGTSYVKIIRKNITLSMVLRKFEEVREFHTHLDINSKGYLTYWESGDEMKYGEEDNTKQVDWILRKDGKDISLYDQSEETIKLVWEVLK